MPAGSERRRANRRSTVRQLRVDARRSRARARQRLQPRRNRLFFFWSQDVLARTDPGVLNQRRMPTALERRGDFSETRDSLNRLIFIRDPQLPGNCNASERRARCFPGNVIPANRIDATAQALLNMFPLPNASDPTGRNLYNYTFQTVTDWPRNDQVLRVDWNVGPRRPCTAACSSAYEKRAGATSTRSGSWAAGRRWTASSRPSRSATSTRCSTASVSSDVPRRRPRA